MLVPPIGGASPAPFGSLPATSPTVGGAIGGLAFDAVETLRAAETAGVGAMTGEVGVREAVDRVMEAERTLRAAVAIRDKLVAGWLDVSRMAI